MTELRVHNFSISLDGYGAGPDQSEENPLGVGGEQLHEWIFPPEGERTAADDVFVQRGVDGIGATIMGRNMFGPVRGPWGSEDWRGWWGEDPPFHHDVFVLTHHARDPVPMAAGTAWSIATPTDLATALAGLPAATQVLVDAGALDQEDLPG